MKKIDKLLKFLRKRVDMEEVNKCIYKAMIARTSVSYAYPLLADEILDLIDEYNSDNNLDNDEDYDWCFVEYSLDEIIEAL